MNYIRDWGRDRFGKVRCLAECPYCLSIVITDRSKVLRGVNKSCGCNRKNHARKHGTRDNGQKHPLYETWKTMRKRCNNPKFKDYKNYGGRGITVCTRWDDFMLFVEDMGERPVGYTLDRIDNDGHYEPANCRWASRYTQRMNQRRMTNSSFTF